MEKSNQQPKPEDCPPKGEPVDLWYYRVERSKGSVSREKREPQAGPASCLSNSASKVADASGEAVLLAESKTEMTVTGEVVKGLPGSKSVARAEGTTSNEGGPKGPFRTNYDVFSSRRRHTRLQGDWSSDVCSSDLIVNYKFRNFAPENVINNL